MNTLFRALVLRRLVRHKLRAVLAVIAVALGVAAFLASLAVRDTVARSAHVVSDALAGGVDLVVEADSGVLPAETAELVRGVPGVTAAAPVLSRWVRIEAERPARVLLLGVDPLHEAALPRRGPDQADVTLTNPLAFVAGRGVLIAPRLAREIGAESGGPLRVLGAGGWSDVTIAGTLPDSGIVDALQGRVIVLPIGGARALLGIEDAAHRVDVVVSGDPAAVAVAVRERLAAVPGLRVSVPGESDGTSEDLLGTVEVGLAVGAVVSLLVGAFLIYHTLSVGVAERRREIGVLRALGATRRQVRWAFAAEAAVLGGAGSVLGVLLGAVLAKGAVEAFAGAISSAYFEADPPAVEIPGTLALLAIVCGVGVSMMAALVPAARASRQAPSDAIRRGPEALRDVDHVMRRIRMSVAGACAVAIAVALLAPDLLGRWSGYVALLSFLFALVATAPAALAFGARALSPLVARLGGIPGRLAADDLHRHPLRSALPAAALAFGLTLVVETLGTVDTLATETDSWIRDDLSGDLFVSSGATVLDMGRNTPFDEGLLDDMRAVPGVDEVIGVRVRILPVNGLRTFVMGLDTGPFRRSGAVAIRDVPRDEALALLDAGTHCLVSDNFARIHGVGVGDVVEIPGVREPLRLPVAARFRHYSWPRGTLAVPRRHFATHLDDSLVDQVSVVLADGASEEAAIARIDELIGGRLSLVVTPMREIRRGAREMLDGFFALSYAQVAVAMAIAFLGVLNALWIAVLLRRREIGLLRAVGATRGQVTASIVLQAVVLGVLGGVAGLVGGVVVEWVVVQRIMPDETGWIYPLRIPYLVAGVFFVLVVAASAVAAILPARLAARTPLREALGYE